MPSVGHLAAGLAGARLSRAPEGVRYWQWATGLSALAFLPDLDVLAFAAGIPYDAPFGHRGAFHSPVFAVILALVVGTVVLAARRPAMSAVVTLALVVGSHGVLDAFTDGGRGVALLWPFSDQRFFAPWRPIPVAPIGLRMLSRRGVSVVLQECLLFLPVFLVAAVPRRAREAGAAGGPTRGCG